MLDHEFLTEGYLPKRLPSSALTVRPHFTERQMTFNTTKKPLIAVDNLPENEEQGYARPTIRKSLMPVNNEINVAIFKAAFRATCLW